jgi:hypothetical protein
MHCRDFFSVVKVSILKSILCDPLRAKLCDHLRSPISECKEKIVQIRTEEKKGLVVVVRTEEKNI